MRHSWKKSDYDDRTAMSQSRRLYARCVRCQTWRISTTTYPDFHAEYFAWGSVVWVSLGRRAPPCNPVD